jgi:hypothetical protein
MKNYLILAAIIVGVLAALYGFTAWIGGTWRTLAAAMVVWTASLGAISLLLSFGDLKSSGVMFTTWGFFFTLPAIIGMVLAFRAFGIR